MTNRVTSNSYGTFAGDGGNSCRVSAMQAASSLRLVRLPAPRRLLLRTIPFLPSREKHRVCYCAASDGSNVPTTAAVLKNQSFLVVGKEWYVDRL